MSVTATSADGKAADPGRTAPMSRKRLAHNGGQPNGQVEPSAPELESLTVGDFLDAIRRRAKYSLGRDWDELTTGEIYQAVAFAVRDRVMDGMLRTAHRCRERQAKRVNYLSMEFLLGRCLSNNLHNLGMFDLCREAMSEIGVDLDDLEETERDPALGNGGLGRLAACLMDSMATMGIPATGYGINYEFGLFKQMISEGRQIEIPDQWAVENSPWQLDRTSDACIVQLYGRINHAANPEDLRDPAWIGWQVVIGVPRDMPVVGYGGETVNVLRLYSARSSGKFDMGVFNAGDYIKAVEQKIMSETISKVLYPSDSVQAGRELRLVQEYFLVACALRDMTRRHWRDYGTFENFPEKMAVQLNDTHPALAVAELMRLLRDEHGIPWERAWELTTATLAYTNHTLMPEALERWPVALIERVLPRHLQIIYEINERFLKQVRAKWPGDEDRVRRMSIIDDNGSREVRMAYLSIVGSHSVNGVAKLHSELVKTALVPDFHQMWPDRFSNKTNGITQRRWLLHANRGLAGLIREYIGDNWITDLREMRRLEKHLEDTAFRDRFVEIKRANKERLAHLILEQCQEIVDPGSLFDIHAKRIHEYKRQLLNVMHVIHLYLSIVEDGAVLPSPRTFVFAGKAAPGYWAAKQIIKLINNVAAVVNHDPRASEQLKVVFMPDFRVSLAERLYPAADLSEQISTAGTEASGTGNMKFALNGALTMGTLDGANIEILAEVGEENIFIFGLRAEEVLAMQAAGKYHPRDYYEHRPRIKRVVDTFASDVFCKDEPGLFRWIFENFLDHGDRYFHLADLESYIEAQERAGRDFLDKESWVRRAILNVARIGRFSSDRTIAEYAEEIWEVKSLLSPPPEPVAAA